MAWVLLLLGVASGASGFLAFGNARLAIDKIETLLLFLIGAVLVTGGAIVRAVDRSSRVIELQTAIRGRGLAPAGRVTAEVIGGSPAAGLLDDPWPEDDPGRRLRRVVNATSAAFLAVALGLLGLWLVVPHVK
jgi:hypothetical protein